MFFSEGMRWIGGAAVETLTLPAPAGPHDYDNLLGRYHPWQNFSVAVFGPVEWNRLRGIARPEVFDCS